MPIYTPTTAAEITGRCNGSGGYSQVVAGDVMIMPVGTFATGTLSPPAGFELVGAGLGKTILTGSIVSDLAGSPLPLRMSGFSVDSSALSEATEFGPNELTDGTFILRDVGISGSTSGNVLTFITDAYPCYGTICRGNYNTAEADVISTKESSTATADGANSRLVLLDVTAHTPGTGSTDQCVTAHDGFRVDMFGGHLYGARGGQTAAADFATTPFNLYGVLIEHAYNNAVIVQASILEQCTIVGSSTGSPAATQYITVFERAVGNQVSVNGFFDTTGSASPTIKNNHCRAGGLYLRYGGTVRVEGNLFEEIGGTYAALRVDTTFTGTVEIIKNICRQAYRCFYIRKEGSPTVLFRNNLAYGAGGAAVFTFGGTGSITWDSKGGYNHLYGTLDGYSPQTGDITTQPTPIDVASFTPALTQYDRTSLEAAMAVVDGGFSDAANPAAVVSAFGTGSTLTSCVTISAAGIRSAVGMASANMDTQFSGIVGGAGGEGAFTGTLTVDDGNGTGLEAAVVIARRGGVLIASGTTDSNGEITDWVFGAYSYDLAVRLSGYQPTTDTVTISGDSWTKTISLTLNSLSASDPGMVTAFGTVRDSAGDTAQGVTCYRMFKASGGTGTISEMTPEAATSDADGIVQWTNNIPGATYYFYRGETTKKKAIMIPSNQAEDYELPDFWGSDD